MGDGLGVQIHCFYWSSLYFSHLALSTLHSMYILNHQIERWRLATNSSIIRRANEAMQ
jgi:hypothetical protein